MTSHEFAKQLLEGEDLPLAVYIESREESTEVCEMPQKLMRQVHTKDTYYMEEVEQLV